MGAFFGSLLAGGLGLLGSLFGAKSQSQAYSDNLDLQKAQFTYQQLSDNWNRIFAVDNELFNRNAFQQQMDLAKSPVSTVVNDGQSVGVNPMAALGQSAGSASYSSTSAPSAGASVSPVSLQDGIMTSLLGSLTSLATSKMNNDTTKKIADKQASLKQQELDIIDENNKANIGLGSERNAISRLEAKIHQQLANANDKMNELDFSRFAHQKFVDYKNLLLAQAKQSLSEKEFADRVSKFNKQFNENVRQFDEKIKSADKDRRMQYVTRIISTIGSLAGSILGKVIPSAPPGFNDPGFDLPF